MKLPIFLDMDEVICDFLEKLFAVYNKQYNKNITIRYKRMVFGAIHRKRRVDLFQPGFLLT